VFVPPLIIAFLSIVTCVLFSGWRWYSRAAILVFGSIPILTYCGDLHSWKIPSSLGWFGYHSGFVSGIITGLAAFLATKSGAMRNVAIVLASLSIGLSALIGFAIWSVMNSSI